MPACSREAGRYKSDYGPQLWSPRHSEGGGPKEKDKGDDGQGRLCRLLSGEIQTAFQTLPLHSAGCSGGATLWGCHALGGSGLTFALQTPLPPVEDTRLTLGKRPSETLPRLPAAGRRWILMGYFTAPRCHVVMTHPAMPTWFRRVLSSSLTLNLWGSYLSSSFSDDKPEGQTRYVTASRSPVAAWQLRDAPAGPGALTPMLRSAWCRAGGVGGASRPC